MTQRNNEQPTPAPHPFTVTFHGHADKIPLADFARLMLATRWNWCGNNRCKHLTIFMDTRDRMLRIYDRDEKPLTWPELERQLDGVADYGPEVKPCPICTGVTPPQPSADVEKVAEEIATELREVIGPDVFDHALTDAEAEDRISAHLRRLVAAKDAEIARLNAYAESLIVLARERDSLSARAERAEAKLRCADDVFTRYGFMTGANPGDELVANAAKLFAERDALKADTARLDWLEKNSERQSSGDFWIRGLGPKYFSEKAVTRAAIDAARATQEGAQPS